MCCAVSAPAGGGPLNVPGSALNLPNPLLFNDFNGLFIAALSSLQNLLVILSLIFIVIGAIMYITSGGDSGRIETAKKAIAAALIGLAIGIAAPAFLKEIAQILGWSDVPSNVSGAKSLLEIAGGVLNFLLSVVGIIALIMLVVGALMYLTAAGDEDRIDTGKKIVKYSIIGITIALAAMVLVRQVAGFF